MDPYVRQFFAKPYLSSGTAVYTAYREKSLPVYKMSDSFYAPVTNTTIMHPQQCLYPQERDKAQLVERQTCNPKVVGLRPGGNNHSSLVSSSKKQWSPSGLGQTISSESRSGVSR